MRTTDLTDIQAIYLINFHVDRVFSIVTCMSLISVVLIIFLPKKKKEKRKTQLRKLKKQLKNIKLRFFFLIAIFTHYDELVTVILLFISLTLNVFSLDPYEFDTKRKINLGAPTAGSSSLPNFCKIIDIILISKFCILVVPYGRYWS